MLFLTDDRFVQEDDCQMHGATWLELGQEEVSILVCCRWMINRRLERKSCVVSANIIHIKQPQAEAVEAASPSLKCSLAV